MHPVPNPIVPNYKRMLSRIFNMQQSGLESMKPLLRLIFPLVALALSALPASAQEGELPEEQILIQKDRKIVLPEITKPQEKVLTTLKPLPKLEQKYSYRDFVTPLPQIDPKMQAPAFRPEPESELRKGYVRIGGGNYQSTALDAWYNSGRRKDLAYSVFLHHLASGSGPVSNSGFSNNAVGLNATYFTPSFTLDGSLRYNRDRFNFYGYDQERYSTRKDDSTKQVFQSVWFQMNMQSRARNNSKLSWRTGLALGNISDHFKASETEVIADGSGRYQIGDSSSVHLFTDFSLLKRTDSAEQSRVAWRLQPEYRFGFKGFQIQAGFQMSVLSEPVMQDNGELKQTSSFHLHPRLNVELALMQEKLRAFGGISGGINRRSLRNVVEQNPFVAADVYLRHENQLLDVYIGLKGAYKSMLQYHSRFSFEKLNQLAFFGNTGSVLTDKFAIGYDSGSTRRISWETEAVYDPGRGYRAGLRFVYYSYTMSKLQEAWHLPRTRLTAFGSVQPMKNLTISSEIFLLSGIRAFNPRSLSTENLPAIVDVNLRGEYRIKTRYAAFLELNNILNNKNPRFLFYPNQGFRLMIGGSVLF